MPLTADITARENTTSVARYLKNHHNQQGTHVIQWDGFHVYTNMIRVQLTISFYFILDTPTCDHAQLSNIFANGYDAQ